jgi:hypothetical protein
MVSNIDHLLPGEAGKETFGVMGTFAILIVVIVLLIHTYTSLILSVSFQISVA